MSLPPHQFAAVTFLLLLISRNHDAAVSIKFQSKKGNCVTLIQKFQNRDKHPHERRHMPVGVKLISSFLRRNEGVRITPEILWEGK